jgi:hypothetical protein
MKDAKIIYDATWVEQELKHISPHEYVKRYKHLINEHTWGAAFVLLPKLIEELAELIEDIKNERR